MALVVRPDACQRTPRGPGWQGACGSGRYEESALAGGSFVSTDEDLDASRRGNISLTYSGGWEGIVAGLPVFRRIFRRIRIGEIPVYVTFELINDEFLSGNGILDQVADGNNADDLI